MRNSVQTEGGLETNNAAFLEDVAQTRICILPIKAAAAVCKFRCILSIRTYIALNVTRVVD